VGLCDVARFQAWLGTITFSHITTCSQGSTEGPSNLTGWHRGKCIAKCSGESGITHLHLSSRLLRTISPYDFTISSCASTYITEVDFDTMSRNNDLKVLWHMICLKYPFPPNP
jgi:hypothetical protein